MLKAFARPIAVALLASGMALGGMASASAEMHRGGGGHHGGGYGGGYYGGPYYGGGYYAGPGCLPILGIVSGNYCNYGYGY